MAALLGKVTLLGRALGWSGRAPPQHLREHENFDRLALVYSSLGLYRALCLGT